MFLRSFATAACCTVLATASLAEMSPSGAPQTASAPTEKALASPKAVADVTLAGKAITITYNAPSMRGRKIMGGLVPYGEVWRTGANPATTLITTANLKVGTLDVPAGTYTLYTLPSASQWLLIVNKQTGQWGTVYKQDMDLGRIPMQAKTLPSPQEKMSITFEHTSGNTTQLHIKWETADEYVTIKAE